MTKRIIAPLIALGVLGLAGMSAAQTAGTPVPIAATSPGSPAAVPSASAAATSSAPGPAVGIIDAKCTACHGAAQITMQRKSADDWAETVQSMVDKGANLTVDEQKAVTAYLAKTYPAT